MESAYSISTVISILRFFKIRYTRNYVQQLLDENSDSNNLWGIVNVLKLYGLILEPCKIDPNLASKVYDTNLPFLTANGNEILLITEIAENTIFGFANGKHKNYCKESFLKNWNGIMVSIGIGESVGEPNFHRHFMNELRITLSRVAVTLTILTLCIYRMSIFNVPYYICYIFILSTLGAILSYQIELSRYSPNNLINCICSLIQRSSCSDLNVGKSRKLTLLGFSYYCSLCAFILLPLNNYSMSNCIVFLSFIEVVWSFFIQFKKRQFCSSCLAIQTITIMMLVIGILNFVKLDIYNLVQQGILFLSIFIIIFNVAFSQIWKSITYQNEYKKKSRMLDYYKKKYLDNSISVENSEDSTIIIIINPFCIPCREDFLSSYNLILNIGCSKVVPIIIASDSKGEKVGISILSENEPVSIFHRLKDWYSWGYKDPTRFMNQYKVSINDEKKLTVILRDNLNIAYEYNVQFTPAIIYNGKKLAKGISLVDVLTQ